MAKILHMADMHLDSPMTSVLSPDAASLRRAEQRETFSRILELAAEESAVLLISGDLFDSGRVSRETVNFLKRRFSEIGNIPVFISAGNHDPYTGASPYKTVDFGSNVHIFGTEPGYFDLHDLKLRVSGVSFPSEGTARLTRPGEFEKHSEYANILVIHGDVQTSGRRDTGYNPISAAELQESGFDYAALGHVHSFSGIEHSGAVSWAYPGIPEPRGFDETGDAGVIIGSVERGSVSLKKISVAKRSCRVAELELTDSVADNEAVIERLAEKLDDPKDLYRIILCGRPRAGFSPDIDLLQRRIEGMAFYTELIDKTLPGYDFEVDDNDGSLRAVYIRMMKKRLAELSAGSREYRIAQEALRLGVDAMESGE